MGLAPEEDEDEAEGLGWVAADEPPGRSILKGWDGKQSKEKDKWPSEGPRDQGQ